MAERRMFAKTIIDSDAFLDMSASAQALYFHLGMRADDDGFVNNPKKIQKITGAAEDDLKILLAKRFIIGFESGVIVIKHWKMHNYIQNDRYKPTVYQAEMERLSIKPNRSYTENPIGISDVSSLDTVCIHSASSLEAQVRLGKDRIDKSNLGQSDDAVATPPNNKRKEMNIPPSVDEVAAYCKERRNKINAEHFVDYYASRGWMLGKAKMKDWKAAVRTWEANDKQRVTPTLPERKYQVISD